MTQLLVFTKSLEPQDPSMLNWPRADKSGIGYAHEPGRGP